MSDQPMPAVNMMDVIDGKRVLYHNDLPNTQYEVVSLLDAAGDEVEDEEQALGGVVKIAEDRFMVFFF